MNFLFNKTIEELLELALILSQIKTRDEEVIPESKIIEEIGDVKLCLAWLESKYNKKEITNRMLNKLQKIENRHVNSRRLSDKLS